MRHPIRTLALAALIAVPGSVAAVLVPTTAAHAWTHCGTPQAEDDCPPTTTTTVPEEPTTTTTVPEETTTTTAPVVIPPPVVVTHNPCEDNGSCDHEAVPTAPAVPTSVPTEFGVTGSHTLRDAGIALAAITLGFALLLSPYGRKLRTNRFGR